MDTFTGYFIYTLVRGYLQQMLICEQCLDEELIVSKRRAIPGTCEICGVGTH